MNAVLSAIKMLILGVWSLITAILGMIAVLFTFKHRSAIWVAQQIWAPVIIAVFGVRIKVKGSENVKPGQPYLIMANHSSFIDIPVLFRAIKLPHYYIAKKELKKIPFLGWYVSAAGMIWIDRSNRIKATESLMKAAALVKGGRNLVIFPEGTATRTGEMGEFKKGGFHLAFNSGATILPVRIRGTRKIWPRGNMFNLSGGTAEVIIGKGIDASQYAGRAVDELSTEVRQLIVDMT